MRAVIALVLVVIITVAGGSAFQAAVVNVADDYTAENESFTPSESPITVDAANTTGTYLNQPANETVRNASQVVMTEGSDYEYYPENGTLVVLDGGDLDGDETGYITYDYQQTTSEQRGLVALLAGHMELLSGLVLVGIVAFLLAILKGVA